MKWSKPCSSCGHRIYVLKLPSKKWMPINADPDPRGNIDINLDARKAEVLTEAQATAARMRGQPLYLSHFATCPYGKKHRRR